MAAAFLYHQQRVREIESLVVASGGFGPAGRRVDGSVVALLEDRGVDLSRKRTRELDAAMVGRADLIVTMTGAQAVRTMTAWPEVATRVFTLRHLCAVVTARPTAESPTSWVRELQDATQRNYNAAGDPSMDIAEPTGDEFGATLNLADQLLAATDHVIGCLWPASSVSSSSGVGRQRDVVGPRLIGPR